MGAGFWVAMNQVTLPLSGVTEPLLAGLSALYDIWVNVALWQCAFNGEKRFSGHVIRFFVVLTFAYMIWSWCQPEPATNAAPEGNAIEQMQQMQQLLERLNKGL